MDPSLSIVLHGVGESERDHCARRARRLTARPLEVLVAEPASSDPPGRLRNRAIAAARGRFVVFLDDHEPPDSSFLEHAMRTLERESAIEFVAAWHDGVPQGRDRPFKLLRIADLLARPWFAFTPTVFRRELWVKLGGFDEELLGLEDLEFWIRAVSVGMTGAVIEEPVFSGRPWGNSIGYDDPNAEREARRVFDRHTQLFQAHWEETVLGKERIVRELMRIRTELQQRAIALHDEERRISELLGRE